MIALKHPCQACGCSCVPEQQADCEKVKLYARSIGPAGLPYETAPTFQTFDFKEVVNMEIPAIAEPSTKICDHPNCAHKNKPQPVENFRVDMRCADGRRGICNDCLDRVGAGRKSPSVRIPMDIWRQLEFVAKREMRNPEQQLLYLIINAYQSRQPNSKEEVQP